VHDDPRLTVYRDLISGDRYFSPKSVQVLARRSNGHCPHR
jgi:hypothetical protein